jgi:hypothetical protein
MNWENVMKSIVLYMVFGAALASGSIAHAKDITYNARIGAKYPIGANREPISVTKFAGRDGPEFTLVLEATLQSAELDGSPVLNVTNGSAAVSIGGAVIDSSLNSTRYSKEERDCANWKGFLKCEQWVTRNVSCERINGSYSVTVAANRWADRKVLFSQNVKYQGEYTVCEGNGSRPQFTGPDLGSQFSNDVSTPDDLLGALRTISALRVRELVAPFNKLVKVKFMSGNAGISKESLNLYKSGMEFANAGRLDRACSMLDDVHRVETNKMSVTLNYNIGVCSEALLPDDPSKAFEYYNQADQLLKSPNKMVSAALARSRELMQQGSRIN